MKRLTNQRQGLELRLGAMPAGPVASLIAVMTAWSIPGGPAGAGSAITRVRVLMPAEDRRVVDRFGWALSPYLLSPAGPLRRKVPARDRKSRSG